MDAQEIDSAKATLDPMYFNCEYLAEDVTLDTMLWAYAFEPNKHLGKVEILKNLEIILSFDFNKNPISCSVLQIPSFDTIRVIETIKLANSDIYELCDVIKTKYGNTLYLITGDASGSSTSAMVQDNMNYYKIIRAKLNLSNNQMMVPVVNPRLADIKAVNKRIGISPAEAASPENLAIFIVVYQRRHILFYWCLFSEGEFFFC